jgi:hypothetical protein
MASKKKAPRPAAQDPEGPRNRNSLLPGREAATRLEDFLVACQKSLGRAVRNAQQSAKTDNEFALGERPVYMISGVEFEVKAAMSVGQRKRSFAGESVLVDFDAPAETRSTIKFRIESRPVELLKGAKLELANLDPLGNFGGGARMRAWLVDDKGIPVSGYPVKLHLIRAGDKKGKETLIAATTDAAGRVDFFIDPFKNDLKIVGDREHKQVFLQGSGRGIVPDEYFVWVTAERLERWERVAEASAPQPPEEIRRDAKGPLTLCSEMHRLRYEGAIK